MTRLTRRESALGVLSQAPLEMDIHVPKARKIYNRLEAELQAECVHWLRGERKTGRLRFVVHAPEGKRTYGQQYHAKATGMDAGYSDLTILIYDDATNRRKTVFCELKSLTGQLSEAQEDWRAWLTERGWEYHVVRSLEQLKGIVG